MYPDMKNDGVQYVSTPNRSCRVQVDVLDSTFVADSNKTLGLT
jgi:hypothetical protein